MIFAFSSLFIKDQDALKNAVLQEEVNNIDACTALLTSLMA